MPSPEIRKTEAVFVPEGLAAINFARSAAHTENCEEPIRRQILARILGLS